MSDASLTRPERIAIRDIASWHGAYRYRPATMRRLAAKGLVECTPFADHTAPEWRLTDAGFAWLGRNPG